MSLSERLETIRNSSRAKFGKEIVATMNRAEEELRQSGIMKRALKADDIAPHFSLPNQDGITISSSELLQQGPLVVTFYRGVW